VDRATGEPVRRYEHEAPWDLQHVDVKKLGNIPDGGGWRLVGRSHGGRNRTGKLTTVPRPYPPEFRARARVRQLEQEISILRRASTWLGEESPDPKERTR
jgi:hypothetical protein